jgi:hypothetical protein
MAHHLATKGEKKLQFSTLSFSPVFAVHLICPLSSLVSSTCGLHYHGWLPVMWCHSTHSNPTSPKTAVAYDNLQLCGVQLQALLGLPIGTAPIRPLQQCSNHFGTFGTHIMRDVATKLTIFLQSARRFGAHQALSGNKE